MHLLVPPWSILDKSQPPAKVPVYRLWGGFGKSKWELFADIQSMVLYEGSCSRATCLISSPRLTRVALPNLCILSHPSSNSIHGLNVPGRQNQISKKLGLGIFALFLCILSYHQAHHFFPSILSAVHIINRQPQKVCPASVDWNFTSWLHRQRRGKNSSYPSTDFPQPSGYIYI